MLVTEQNDKKSLFLLSEESRLLQHTEFGGTSISLLTWICKTNSGTLETLKCLCYQLSSLKCLPREQ